MTKYLMYASFLALLSGSAEAIQVINKFHSEQTLIFNDDTNLGLSKQKIPPGSHELTLKPLITLIQQRMHRFGIGETEFGASLKSRMGCTGGVIILPTTNPDHMDEHLVLTIFQDPHKPKLPDCKLELKGG
jgi:hypothetical protein